MCEIEYYYEYKWVKDLYRKAGKARKAVADRKMIKDQTIRIRDLKTGVIRVSCDTITDRWEATNGRERSLLVPYSLERYTRDWEIHRYDK